MYNKPYNKPIINSMNQAIMQATACLELQQGLTWHISDTSKVRNVPSVVPRCSLMLVSLIKDFHTVKVTLLFCKWKTHLILITSDFQIACVLSCKFLKWQQIEKTLLVLWVAFYTMREWVCICGCVCANRSSLAKIITCIVRMNWRTSCTELQKISRWNKIENCSECS